MKTAARRAVVAALVANGRSRGVATRDPYTVPIFTAPRDVLPAVTAGWPGAVEGALFLTPGESRAWFERYARDDGRLLNAGLVRMREWGHEYQIINYYPVDRLPEAIELGLPSDVEAFARRKLAESGAVSAESP